LVSTPIDAAKIRVASHLTVDKETVRRSLIASMVQTLPAFSSSFYALLIKTALIPSGIPMS